MAATYHHARRLYIGTTAERAAVVLDVDGIGTDYWDTDVGVLYIWDGTAWVAGFAALPHDILSATHDDTTPAVVVRGDLMTGQGVAPLWQRLAHPGALYHLQTDANDVIWSQDIIMADDSHIGGTGLLDGRIIFDYTPAPDEIHVADATLVMDTSHILPAGAGQDLGSGIARWDVFAAFVDLPGAGWIGVGPASERLIFNVAGDATFAGVTSVVVPDGCWVGADAACSWVYNSTSGYVTTLDAVGVGIAAPESKVHIYIGDSGRAPNIHTALFVEDSDFTFIEVAAGATGWSGIYFSDNTLDRAGRFEYDHTNRVLNLYNNTHRLKLDSVGNVIVGLVASAGKLHVDNDGAIAQPVAYFDQGDVSEEMFEFATTIGVGNAIEAVGGKTLTVTHFVKVTLPGALTRYFPVGTIA